MPVVPTDSLNDHSWLLRWEAGQRKTVYLCAIVFGFCGFVLLIYLQKTWNEYSGQTPGHPAQFGDFFALWSYAKIMALRPAGDLYDIGILHAQQVALGMDPDAQNPYPYPPVFLLLIWPLGLLPCPASYVLWTAGTLALFVWAVRSTCSRLPVCLIGAILAPTSIATIASGQSGFLSAALITAGVRLAGCRPAAGGLLIGLLAYKPQLGLLVPVALASAGFWRAFRVACATAIGLAGVTTLVFGWDIWAAWLAMLPEYAARFDGHVAGLKLMPTVVANLRIAGVPLLVARGLQGLMALLAGGLVWRLFRRGPRPLAAAALLVATMLATPHALIYDMPMTTAAMALFLDARLKENPVFGLGEVVILIQALLSPLLMMAGDFRVPISPVSSLLLLGLIVATYRRQSAGRERTEGTP